MHMSPCERNLKNNVITNNHFHSILLQGRGVLKSTCTSSCKNTTPWCTVLHIMYAAESTTPCLCSYNVVPDVYKAKAGQGSRMVWSSSVRSVSHSRRICKSLFVYFLCILSYRNGKLISSDPF